LAYRHLARREHVIVFGPSRIRRLRRLARPPVPRFTFIISAAGETAGFGLPAAGHPGLALIAFGVPILVLLPVLTALWTRRAVILDGREEITWRAAQRAYENARPPSRPGAHALPRRGSPRRTATGPDGTGPPAGGTAPPEGGVARGDCGSATGRSAASARHNARNRPSPAPTKPWARPFRTPTTKPPTWPSAAPRCWTPISNCRPTSGVPTEAGLLKLALDSWLAHLAIHACRRIQSPRKSETFSWLPVDLL
jgi:hypothetical protein